MNDSILIIDDEVDFLDSVRRGLLSAGLKNLRLESDPRVVATAVQNGEHFDMALIDITMPWINGIQLLEMIKTNSPDTECIMVTAVNEARVAVECLQKGAYDYLTKPISRDELVSTLKRAMERRPLLENHLRRENGFASSDQAQGRLCANYHTVGENAPPPQGGGAARGKRCPRSDHG